ncbi:hypothetical protein XELAEV_18041821mg [Xenopus laevis]|uniref:Uncharacterized protein n=1 Tax=Xenopus laevis TaxID=8355 RepID=A0A974H5I6_XENLA|nr:hypothetical protein XELAEV_18041821mg [Xenopus laevis]
MGIDQITSSTGGLDKNTLLLRRKVEWIFRLNTVTPFGLNESLNLSCFFTEQIISYIFLNICAIAQLLHTLIIRIWITIIYSFDDLG